MFKWLSAFWSCPTFVALFKLCCGSTKAVNVFNNRRQRKLVRNLKCINVLPKYLCHRSSIMWSDILPTAVPESWGCWFPGGPGLGKRFDAVWRSRRKRGKWRRRGRKKGKKKSQLNFSSNVPDLFHRHADSPGRRRVHDENFSKHRYILPIMQPTFPSRRRDGNLLGRERYTGCSVSSGRLKKQKPKEQKKRKEGGFTLVISHFVRGLSLTGQRRAGRERQ